MKRIAAAAALSLGCATLAAHAGDTATYKFKGLVEYGSGPGTPPTFPPQQGVFAFIDVTLDKKAVASTTSNTATYRGGVACPPNPDPIVAISVRLGKTVDPYVGPGNCDEVVIQQNVNGVYSISIQNFSYQTGSSFTAIFTGTSPNAVTSLAIPDKIDTSAFDRSTFMVLDGGEDVQSGDMASRVAPP